MKIKQLAELLNVDIRKIARRTFKKELDIQNVSIVPLDGGDYHITILLRGEEQLHRLSFDFDCHGHLITIIGGDYAESSG